MKKKQIFYWFVLPMVASFLFTYFLRSIGPPSKLPFVWKGSPAAPFRIS